MAGTTLHGPVVTVGIVVFKIKPCALRTRYIYVFCVIYTVTYRILFLMDAHLSVRLKL
jgi:hypothetical protein